MTIRFPDGRIVYINDRDLAASAAHAASSVPACDVVPVPDDLSQRLATIEAGLRVQSELKVNGSPLPCLSQAIIALRSLNKLRRQGQAPMA